MRQLRNPFYEQPFVSSKSSAPVPVAGHLRFDALVQAALDPAIEQIGFVRSATVGDVSVTLNLPVLFRARQRFALDIPELRPLRSVDEEGLTLLAIQKLGLSVLEVCAAEINHEPRASNAREVWRHKEVEVPFETEREVIDLLKDSGPQHLYSLLQRTGACVECIWAMACADLTVVALHACALGADTVISLSPRYRFPRRTTRGAP